MTRKAPAGELEIGAALARTPVSEARDWTLAEVRPRRLISLIRPENARSNRVAEKLGERFDREILTKRRVRAELWVLPEAGRTSS